MPILILTITLNAWSSDLSVMTYNLENLFDTKHDQGKEDYTYLPLKFKQNSKEVQKYCQSLANEYYRKSCLTYDWNDSILEKKLQNLAAVIKEYNNHKGADILVFEEVENLSVLKMLFNRYLSDLGYNTPILLEGPDERGIDVAVVSKFKTAEVKYHEVDTTRVSKRPTRGILEVTLNSQFGKITVFANHWPSQGNPDSHREIAAKTLRAAADKVPHDHIVIAMGDFNTLPDDMPHGINTYITNPELENAFVDIAMSKEVRRRGFVGSHWYRNEWSMLDRIFLLKRNLKRVAIDWDSFEVIKRPFMVHNIMWRDYETGETTEVKDIPKRFDPKTGEGHSDHLPVAVGLQVL